MRLLLRDIRAVLFEKPEVLRAYADLARSTWPLAALLLGLVVIFIFKGDIKKVIPNAKEVSIGGLTVTLQDKLAEEVVPIQVSTQAAGIYVPGQGQKGDEETLPRPARAQAAARIYSKVEDDPRAALIATADEVDNAVRELLADAGYAQDITARPEDNVRRLAERGYIPPSVRDATLLFFSVENSLLQNKSASKSDLLSAIHSGATIVQGLNSTPFDRNTVFKADIPIFSDDKAQNPLPGSGVMLETTRIKGGQIKTYRIFPTTRVGYYREGMQVSWEWNFERTWGKAWYRDPETKEIKSAWEGSGNFIGRDLKELFK